MATPADHYREAERLVDGLATALTEATPVSSITALTAIAQVHATLATAPAPRAIPGRPELVRKIRRQAIENALSRLGERHADPSAFDHKHERQDGYEMAMNDLRAYLKALPAEPLDPWAPYRIPAGVDIGDYVKTLVEARLERITFDLDSIPGRTDDTP